MRMYTLNKTCFEVLIITIRVIHRNKKVQNSINNFQTARTFNTSLKNVKCIPFAIIFSTDLDNFEQSR